MVELGYKLSSEEFGPLELVQHAKRAEDMGFEFANSPAPTSPETPAGYLYPTKKL